MIQPSLEDWVEFLGNVLQTYLRALAYVQLPYLLPHIFRCRTPDQLLGHDIAQTPIELR
jgi:hypothetical protein